MVVIYRVKVSLVSRVETISLVPATTAAPVMSAWVVVGVPRVRLAVVVSVRVVSSVEAASSEVLPVESTTLAATREVPVTAVRIPVPVVIPSV